MATLARAAAPTASVITGDMQTLDRDRRFDASVMLGRVFPHVPSATDAGRFRENCLSHLEPGGVTILTTVDLRGTDPDHRTEDTFDADCYRVERHRESVVTDRDAGRWRFDATYTLTDRETGESATARETLQLRAHDPHELEQILETAGFTDVLRTRDSAFSLRTTAQSPETYGYRHDPRTPSSLSPHDKPDG